MKHSHDFDFRLSYTKTGRPYIVVDNFLTSEEYDVVMEELDTIIRPHMRRNGTGGALSLDGKPIKNSNACFVDEIFEDPSASSTFVIMQKFLLTKICLKKYLKAIGRLIGLISMLSKKVCSFCITIKKTIMDVM